MQETIYKVLVMVLILLAMSFITILAWEQSVSKIFEIRSINFSEAIALNILSKILFQNIEIKSD
jgi:hypothetical protein